MPSHRRRELVGVNGHRLWVEREGRGEPLLVVGGAAAGGCHPVFHTRFSDIDRDYEVISVDLWGHGRSAQPDRRDVVTFAADVDDVRTLIRQLGIGPVHVYALSYGAFVAHQVARDSPVLLRTLALRLDACATGDRAGPPGDQNRDLHPLMGDPKEDAERTEWAAFVRDVRQRSGRLSVPLLVFATRHDRGPTAAPSDELFAQARSVLIADLERDNGHDHAEHAEAVRKQLLEFHRSRPVFEHLLDFQGAV